MAYYHFEMLGLGYAAYLTFRDFCQSAFPGIADQTIAKMVARHRHPLLPARRRAAQAGRARHRARPRRRDPARGGSRARRCWRRSPGARRSGLARGVRGGQGAVVLVLDRGRATPTSTAPGSTTCGCRSTPCAATSRSCGPARTSPVRWTRSGPSASGSFSEYRELLDRPTRPRGLHRRCCELARTVYPFVENHNFYVEHWHHSIFWNKVREFGARARRGRLPRGRRGHLLPAPLRDPRRALRPAAPAGRPARRRAAPATGRPRSPSASEIMERCAVVRRRPRSAWSAERHRAVHGDAVRGITTDTVRPVARTAARDRRRAARDSRRSPGDGRGARPA